MNKGILLDRDGVVIKERGDYNFLPEHAVMVEGIEQFMQQYRDKGFVFIIITNQGGIARGYYSHDNVKNLHHIIDKHLANHGVAFSDWLYCPHHDKISRCLCRKPDSLMIERAMARHRLDPKATIFIGDKDSDIQAGERAGIHTLKIASNDNLCHYRLAYYH